LRTRKKSKRSYIEDENGNLVTVPKKRKLMKTSLTRPHRILIRICESLGLEWQDEVKFGKYSLDVYIPSLKLCIECDGLYWHTLEGVPQKDKRRDKYLLENYGIKTLRITDEELNTNKKEVIARITAKVKECL
jgi:very-short-patch-repair endonuclease